MFDAIKMWRSPELTARPLNFYLAPSYKNVTSMGLIMCVKWILFAHRHIKQRLVNAGQLLLWRKHVSTLTLTLISKACYAHAEPRRAAGLAVRLFASVSTGQREPGIPPLAPAEVWPLRLRWKGPGKKHWKCHSWLCCGNAKWIWSLARLR